MLEDFVFSARGLEMAPVYYGLEDILVQEQIIKWVISNGLYATLTGSVTIG